MSVLSMLAEERGELVALLRELTDDEWEAESLCAGWRVRDVVGHLLWDTVPVPVYSAVVIRNGLSADRTNNALVAKAAALSTEQLADKLATRHGTFSRVAPTLVLADMMVHHQDIRRPLGRGRSIPPERVRAVLDHPDPFARPGRYRRGLRWAATDLDWAHGSGPEVRGPGEALALAMVGRPAALADLEGDGVPMLRQRCGA